MSRLRRAVAPALVAILASGVLAAQLVLAGGVPAIAAPADSDYDVASVTGDALDNGHAPEREDDSNASAPDAETGDVDLSDAESDGLADAGTDSDGELADSSDAVTGESKDSGESSAPTTDEPAVDEAQAPIPPVRKLRRPRVRPRQRPAGRDLSLCAFRPQCRFA